MKFINLEDPQNYSPLGWGVIKLTFTCLPTKQMLHAKFDEDWPNYGRRSQLIAIDYLSDSGYLKKKVNDQKHTYVIPVMKFTILVDPQIYPPLGESGHKIYIFLSPLIKIALAQLMLTHYGRRTPAQSNTKPLERLR